MILLELQKHGKGMFGISCLEFFAQNSQHNYNVCQIKLL